MKYLRVKNWERFQHQSTKRLPWIKLFTELLEPTRQPEYASLPDATKALLIHIWLMASVWQNRIPAAFLTRDRLNLQSRVSLDLLLDAGYVQIVDESIPLAGTDARSELSQSNPSHFEFEFDSIWKEYPNRIGRKDALRHYLASVVSPEDVNAVGEALRRYKAHLAANEWKKPQNGSTWFANWRDWLDFEEPTPIRSAIGPDSLPLQTHGVARLEMDVEAFVEANGRRPKGAPTETWDAAFSAAFGFTPDEWIDADQDQREAWAKRRAS
jgi:hypothetical protein